MTKISFTVFLSFAIALMLLAGFSLSLDEQNEQAVKAGKTLYTKYCSSCHGMEGKGDGHGNCPIIMILV